MIRDTIGDVETYPNIFTICMKPVDHPTGVFFEISERRQDQAALWRYLQTIERFVGFNNIGFDWPILQYFLENPGVDHTHLYARAQEIIGSMDRFRWRVWQPAVPQLDLFLIHHFDNRAKSASLKSVEFARRARSVQDLPFPPGTYLSPAEMDHLIAYNGHDVLETEGLYHDSLEKIRFRESLNEPYWLNYNDGKIGEAFFVKALNGAGVETHYRDDETGRREPHQTERPHGVPLRDVILPYLWFANPTLAGLLDLLKGLTIYETKGTHDWPFQLAGVDCVMGCGGMHGCIPRSFVDGRGDREILDIDVKSFYPQIAIQNLIYPLHLGPIFCQIYAQLYDRRMAEQPGSSNYAALKLALNVPFGKSNSDYGPFKDMAYFLAITINGQLLILSLAERLLSVPTLELVQLNTDGVTVTYPRELAGQVRAIFDEWSAATRMPLETKIYSRMWVRDVNNYIAEEAGTGKLKNKGAYLYKRELHQDHSMLVVRKAAEAAMVRGVDLEDFIRNHPDPMDFMMRVKPGAGSYILLDDGTQLRGLVRYYLSPRGRSAVKKMPSTTTRLHAGGHAYVTGTRNAHGCSECDWTGKTKKAHKEHAEAEHASKIVICNTYDGQPIEPDYRFYVAEARKLIIGAGEVPLEVAAPAEAPG